MKRLPIAFLASGFTLGIPVFFDTVFYLLYPLARSVGKKNPRQYGLYILAILAGAAMAHSLVPPTPGPLFVAVQLNINLAYMIIGGLCVGIITITVGYLYAKWVNQKWPIPIRDFDAGQIDSIKQSTVNNTQQLPSLFLSLLPIILPIVLIATNTFLQLIWKINPSSLQVEVLNVLKIIGDPQIALTLAAGMALWIQARQFKSWKSVKAVSQEALINAGMIVLIIGAGGAFGQMLQQTGIGQDLSIAADYQYALIPIAFFLTAMIRTAQGSATVAMITSIGILAEIISGTNLTFHPVYIALAVGCGSKPFPWMNDSGFWIVCKMAGLSEIETLKSFSVMLSIMGLTGLVVVWLAAYLLPLV